MMPSALATAVYDAVTDHTESLELDDMIGPDLAYLMGAILKGTGCEWPAGRPILAILRNAFPAADHPVWGFIAIDPDDDDAAPAVGAPAAGGPTDAARAGLATIRGMVGRMYESGGWHPAAALAPGQRSPRDEIRAALDFLAGF
jgi:hypothetical protein